MTVTNKRLSAKRYFMRTSITSDLSRLSLHDSSFEEIIRQDQNLYVTFDWSKLDNFKEENFDEVIIMGKTRMSLTCVHSEEFKVFDSEGTTKFILRSLPEDYTTEAEVIGANAINDDIKAVTIGKLHKENGAYCWTEWSFEFDTCKLSWTSFVTYTEWKNGKLPVD